MTLRAGSSENRRFQEETKGQKLSPQNRSLPFKIGELEQIKKFLRGDVEHCCLDPK